jgi:predicted nucleic acid-binding protein
MNRPSQLPITASSGMPPELRIDTGAIGQLRKFIDGHPKLFESVGQFAQLRVVIDANFVVSDLLRKIKYPERGKTALEELMHSTVLEVFAPRWLEKELPSTFQQVANRRKVSEADLWAEWQGYQVLLKWDETYDSPPEEFAATDDPKDLPYIFLEKKLDAFGILSKDNDIGRMGGKPLTFDFVFATRSYARAAVISVAVKVFGLYLGTISIAGLLRLAGLLKSGFEGLPPRIRLVLLVALVIAFIHPTSRAWITGKLKKLGPIANVAIESVTALASIELQQREVASTQLKSLVAMPNPIISQGSYPRI